MLGLPGGVEWIIILIIALLLFGKRLPNVMRSLGQGVKEFKRGVNSVEDQVDGLDEGEPEDTSSGELPEGEYEGEYEYEDEYTEEGYREPEGTQGAGTEGAEPAGTGEETAAPEAEEDMPDESEETSKPAG
jgi:sec-independent protein translocase protein TatA